MVKLRKPYEGYPTAVVSSYWGKKDPNPLRQQWIEDHLCEDGEENLHPDQRAIQCPCDLLLASEWESRHESSSENYILGDGAWYDPYSEQFFGVRTIRS